VEVLILVEDNEIVVLVVEVEDNIRVVTVEEIIEEDTELETTLELLLLVGMGVTVEGISEVEIEALSL
jgi:hypothetical protein